MNTDFVNLTTENLANEHLCCIIRSRKPHPGVEAKRQWLAERIKEGHIFRKIRCLYAWLKKTKELPCVFNNYAVFYKGTFETVNLLDIDYLKRILKKQIGIS